MLHTPLLQNINCLNKLFIMKKISLLKAVQNWNLIICSLRITEYILVIAFKLKRCSFIAHYNLNLMKWIEPETAFMLLMAMILKIILCSSAFIYCITPEVNYISHFILSFICYKNYIYFGKLLSKIQILIFEGAIFLK